jgi:hypothetical protein
MNTLERAKNLVKTIDTNLDRWRAWFPNEESAVDVPRADLLALKEYAELGLAVDKAAEKLPGFCTIEIEIGGGSAVVTLRGESGTELEFPTNYESVADQINDAVEYVLELTEDER